MPENQFYYYGIDYINYENNYYISEEGSGILLYYEINDDYLSLVSKIYTNINLGIILSNCSFITEKYCWKLYLYTFYFEENKILPLAYYIPCGIREQMDDFVYKLDKNKISCFLGLIFYYLKEEINVNHFSVKYWR